MNYELALFIVSALLIIALVYIVSKRQSTKREYETLEDLYDKDTARLRSERDSLEKALKVKNKELLDCQGKLKK